MPLRGSYDGLFHPGLLQKVYTFYREASDLLANLKRFFGVASPQNGLRRQVNM